MVNLVTLNNGLKMPQLGFGVWQVEDEQVTAAVAKALEVGYTSIDTAMIYKNETGVGKAIKESGIPLGKPLCHDEGLEQRSRL